MVTINGQTIEMPAQPESFDRELTRLREREHILGFYIVFHSKTMSNARAYFPSLSVLDANMKISLMCPVRALVDMSHLRILRDGFLRTVGKKMTLTKYLRHLTGIKTNIAPYALRIGGRSWLLARGMDRQFVDFLGTWKSPEASARYFRAAPREVLLMLRRFYFEQNATL